MALLNILFAVGAMIFWGVGDFLIQRGTRKLGNLETLAWIGILGSLGLLPFVWNDLWLVFERSNFLILLLLGLVTFAVGIINFEALRRGKLSVVEVLLEFELPISVLLGVLFLSERLSLLQIGLIGAIFCGVLMIAAKPGSFRGHRSFLEHGAALGILTALGYGLINFLTAVGAKHIAPLLAIWFPWLTFGVICVVYLACRPGGLRSAVLHARSYPGLIITIGAIDTLAWVFFALALAHKELAIVIAITESYPAISLMLGVHINQEKISRLQAFGAAITIAASFLMAFS